MFLINLWNFYTIWLKKKGRKEYAGQIIYVKYPPPKGFLVKIADLGTMLFWALLFLYILFILLNLIPYLEILRIIPLNPVSSTLGLIFFCWGFLLQGWAILTCGSSWAHWDMREHHELITHGPYRYVRHPFILGYIFILIGFFFIWPNLLTCIPLFSIPGYFRVVNEEEKMLIKRFGERYLLYQERVGKLLPKLRRTDRMND